MQSCSIAKARISSQPWAKTALAASVAPLVNTTSPGSAMTRPPTCHRACSTIARAARPSAWTLDGFPTWSIAASIAARASGLSGAEAFQSR